MDGRVELSGTQGDFRAKATRGVALAALTLLLPFVVVNLVEARYVAAAGTAAIVTMLALNAWLVSTHRDHELLTVCGLVPGGMLFMTQVFLIDGIVWCYPSILACYCMLSHRRALLANAIVLAFALPMIWHTLDPALAGRFGATLLAVSVFASIMVREIDAMRARLRFQIEHDPLTGLLNRTSLKGRLQEAIDAYRDGYVPSALISVDLDHFKAINDRFGHDVGDLVLSEVARLLRERVRPDDAVFRLGGEEFMLLLRGIDADAAMARAEALRARIEQASILQQQRVTASFGLAPLEEIDDRISWTRRVDERLYTAKRAGRNRVVGRAAPGPASRPPLHSGELAILR